MGDAEVCGTAVEAAMNIAVRLTVHKNWRIAYPQYHVPAGQLASTEQSSYYVCTGIGPDLFAAGQEVDVTGTSKGKGYAGVMKLHGFHGVGASHGAHKNHRKPGSIGACATPGRVFKGVRMSGRMGSDTVTTQNVTVHAVDAEKGLILLKGAVPGPKGSLIVLRSATKTAAKLAQKEA